MTHEGLLIIGYGNELRGDDAVGPLAARKLADRGFDALALHQLTPELAERIAAARAVIFLDADACVPPGQVVVEPIAPGGAASTLGHYAGSAGLLSLARAVYGASPDAWQIRIGAETFEFGEATSAAAERAVRAAIDETIRISAQL